MKTNTCKNPLIHTYRIHSDPPVLSHIYSKLFATDILHKTNTHPWMCIYLYSPVNTLYRCPQYNTFCSYNYDLIAGELSTYHKSLTRSRQKFYNLSPSLLARITAQGKSYTSPSRNARLGRTKPQLSRSAHLARAIPTYSLACLYSSVSLALPRAFSSVSAAAQHTQARPVVLGLVRAQ